jgi:hypothetical protein
MLYSQILFYNLLRTYAGNRKKIVTPVENGTKTWISNLKKKISRC